MRFLLPLTFVLSACSVSGLLPGAEAPKVAADANGICAAGEVQVVSQKMGKGPRRIGDAAPEQINCLRPGAELTAWIAQNKECGTRLELRGVGANPEAELLIAEQARECRQALLKKHGGGMGKRAAGQVSRRELGAGKQGARSEIARSEGVKPLAKQGRGEGRGMRKQQRGAESSEAYTMDDGESASVTQ
jgi:hypothetical protein